jgi:hypothetical protein
MLVLSFLGSNSNSRLVGFLSSYHGLLPLGRKRFSLC